MPSEKWWKDIHERILGSDKIAPAELAEAVLALLERHLRMNHQKIRDEELIADAAVDAVMTYVKEPAKFDPSKRSLLGYLKMAANGDLLNRLAKEGRRKDRSPGGTDPAVELDESAGKMLAGVRHAADEHIDPVSKTIVRLFTTERDRRIAHLIVEGERSTAKFAALLGIAGRPTDEQRAIVKKHKDRVKKVLQRRGRECRG